MLPLHALNNLAGYQHKTHPTLQHKPAATLICCHGWGADHNVWQPLAEHVEHYGLAVFAMDFLSHSEGLLSFEQTAALIARAILQLVEQGSLQGPVYLVGWSLGGQLAAAVAQRLPAQINGLVTLASNPCFVQKAGWINAMPAETFGAFAAGFEGNPQATFKRFIALQTQGASEIKKLRPMAKQYLPLPHCLHDPALATAWAAALQWLCEDTRTALASLAMPQLHIVASGDALVPALGSQLAHFGEVHYVEGSHCLPLESPEAIARALQVFTKTHSPQALNKRRIAKAFGDAAKDYDNLADVQQHVAYQLAERFITQTAQQPLVQACLDIGSGTGMLSQQLAGKVENLVALDLAEGMLRYARQKTVPQKSLPQKAYHVAGDAEALPFASNSFDAVVSSLAVQWCSNVDDLLSEIARILKPGGHAVIATLGPQTLWQLKNAWQQLDGHVHVNAFFSRPQWHAALQKSAFKEAEIEQQTLQYHYPSLAPLLRSLKGIGAHNSHAGAPKGLMTQQKFRDLDAAYFRDNNGNLCTTYDVIYCHLKM